MTNVLPRLFRNKLIECKYLTIPLKNNYSNFCKYERHIPKELIKFQKCKHASLISIRKYSEEKKTEQNIEPKLTLFQRFKSMYKDYWYVLIPVHVVTSVGWFGGFYYMAKSGVDVIGVLETMKVNEKIIDSMRNSQMGYVAIAYACYKIATPARYTVTLGGTTISINYLKKWGYIKPVPSAEKLKEIYKTKKDNFDKTFREKKEDLIARKDEFKQKIDDRLEQGINKIEELKEKTDKIKKKAENIMKDKK